MLYGSIEKFFTVDGTSDGIITIDDNSLFYVNAVVNVISNTQPRLDLIVTDLIGGTQVRVRDFYPVSFTTYKDISAYLVSNNARVVRPNAQLAAPETGGGGGGITALTGDGSASGTGSVALTVTKTNGVAFAASATTDTTDAGNISSGTLSNSRLSAIPNASLDTMPAHTFKGNNTGSIGLPLDLTAAQLTAGLNVFSGSLQGVVTASGGGTVNFLRADGAWSTPPDTGITALTNDVTASGSGSVAATIASHAVTNAKSAQMAAHTFKGNNTGSTADASDLTATQLTAELNAFSSSLQGVTPASGGGSSNFLRADGSWAVPAGTGITALTGDGSASGSGSVSLTVTKTNGVAFAASATTDTTDASNIGSGTLSNARTTATSSNTISTIVARDGSGNFAAGTISAALTGTASGNTTYSANNHGVVLSGTTNAMTVIAPDASTSKLLISGGSSADPSWSLITNSSLSGSAAITNANLATMAAHTFKGNNTGTSSTPLDLTISQLMSELSLSGTNSGDVTLTVVGSSPNANAASLSTQALTLQPFDSTNPGVVTASGGGTSNFLRADGAWGVPAGTGITALTSDVTASGTGSVAATIANNAVTNAKAAQMAAHTFKGNNTGSTTNALDLTATQLTAELNAFTTSLQGVVPSSGGGTVNFLRADGNWSTPPDTGMTALTGDVTASGSGSVASTVAKINGVTLGSTTATSGNLLIGSGSQWVTNAVAGDVAITSSGVTSIALLDSIFFGDGSDGDVAVSSGTTTLARDMYYHNLTISGTGVIDTAGFRIFCSGTLDISAAPTLAIRRIGSVGSNSTSSIAGNGGGVLAAGSLGSGAAGNQGGNATTTNGGPGGNGAVQTSAGVGIGGAGGDGGSGSGGTAGTGGTAVASTQFIFRRLSVDTLRGATLLAGTLVAAAGGGAGAGSSTQSGGGGGGGGTSGAVIGVWARTINRGGSTAASCISVTGKNGGNGFTTAQSNTGGGGGGAGGGGGWVIIGYRFLTGSTATNCIDVSGANGGLGGNGVSTGSGGNGGVGGGGGTVQLFNLSTQTWTVSNGSAGSSTGTTHSGVTGGGAGAGNSTLVSL